MTVDPDLLLITLLFTAVAAVYFGYCLGRITEREKHYKEKQND